MIVDSSALIAILKEEPESDRLMTTMASADALEMSAATYLEAGIVADGNNNPLLSARLDDVIETLAIAIAPVTEAQAKRARAAYRQYGKGSGHAAGLNFGDCFSYALAMEQGQPLLFKGADFGQTDVGIAS
ncbi:MAG: type II toxin-antitoxin system VapC family toxin [Novosphingobium sp.]|nr:type II toxin-antitoxin system VapC family toxin [Novosphingobium sp.]